MLMAAYFVVAVHIAIVNGHYISVPFLLLFLFGFGYVGALSAWQGGFVQSLRGLWQRPGSALPVSMMSSSLVAAMPDATPGPVMLPMEALTSRPVRARAEDNSRERVLMQ